MTKLQETHFRSLKYILASLKKQLSFDIYNIHHFMFSDDRSYFNVLDLIDIQKVVML